MPFLNLHDSVKYFKLACARDIFGYGVHTKLDCEHRCMGEISESVAATTYFWYIFYIFFFFQEAYTREIHREDKKIYFSQLERNLSWCELRDCENTAMCLLMP